MLRGPTSLQRGIPEPRTKTMVSKNWNRNNRQYFSRLRESTIVTGRRPTLKHIVVKFQNTTDRVTILSERKGRSHAKEWESKWHQTSQKQS